ncbi:hypothetical protein D3C73_778840 [compost metagenome]
MSQISPLISLRRRIAATISRTPENTDQNAMLAQRNVASTSVATKGETTTTTPVAIPRRPLNISQPQRLPLRMLRIAATRPNTPSAKANAPKTSVSARSDSAGMTKASTAMINASTPRNTNAHQFRDRLHSMSCILSVGFS